MAAVELQANGLPKIIEADGDEGNVVDLSTVEIVPLGPPQAQPKTPVRLSYDIHAIPNPTAPLTASQMKRDIRARLKVVRKEIALRKKLEREEQQLVRLLKAVNEKPPTVRAIRATA